MERVTVHLFARNGRVKIVEKVKLPEGRPIEATLKLPAERTAIDGLRKTFGGWKGLLDCEQFEKDVYARRRRPRKAAKL